MTDACYSTSVSGPGHIYNFSQRQRGWHLDTANQDASNGHTHVIEDTVEPSVACPGLLPPTAFCLPHEGIKKLTTPAQSMALSLAVHTNSSTKCACQQQQATSP